MRCACGPILMSFSSTTTCKRVDSPAKPHFVPLECGAYEFSVGLDFSKTCVERM